MGIRQLKITSSITNRGDDRLGQYLSEISRLDMVTPEEEAELAARIRQGDSKAIEKLVKANLRFVVSVAKQYQNQGLSLADLVNEGNIGLIRAAEKFDETRGFRFISYAVWWVRQCMQQAIYEHARLVRLPISRAEAANKLKHASRLLEQQLERTPSEEELAEMLQMDTAEVAKTIRRSAKHVSLDSPLTDGEDGSLIDVLENHNAPHADYGLAHLQSLKLEINRTLSQLSDTQQKVLCAYFGINADRALSLEEIGERLHLSRERIRQIKDKALEKLKKDQQTAQLRTYLAA
ncbi:MAG: sigma-70 family RNA polymerase sigma factor [Flavisolibacter sp.]